MSNQYLFSSIRPSKVERNAVLNEVDALGDKKRQVLETTRESEELLLSLRREECLINEELMRRLAHISPIRRLPVEVLGNVFEYYVEDGLKHASQLQLVSKLWRYIVKNSPQLWTRIELIGPFHSNRLGLYKRHIDICIINSGNLPLRITFRDGLDQRRSFGPRKNDSRYTYKPTNDLLQYLTIHASKRWVLFDIRCRFSNLWPVRGQTVYSRILCETTRLRHLVLHDCVSGEFMEGRELGLSSLLSEHYSESTTLKTVDLYDVEFHLHNKLSPLCSVQVLNIGFTEDGKWRDLLEEAMYRSWLSLFPQLRKLTLNASEALFVPSSYSSAVERDARTMLLYEEYVAEHLVELCFHGPAPPWALHNVTFPALKTMKIEANWRSSHVLDEAEHWDGIYLGLIQDLYILCSKCCEFWNINRNESNYNSTRRRNRAIVQQPLSRFLDVERVHARSCVWRQIDVAIDSSNDEIYDAAEGPCSALRTVSGESWRDVLQLSDSGSSSDHDWQTDD